MSAWDGYPKTAVTDNVSTWRLSQNNCNGPCQHATAITKKTAVTDHVSTWHLSQKQLWKTVPSLSHKNSWTIGIIRRCVKESIIIYMICAAQYIFLCVTFSGLILFKKPFGRFTPLNAHHTLSVAQRLRFIVSVVLCGFIVHFNMFYYILSSL